MDSGVRKRRGRPLKESDNDDSVLSQRRTRVRQAQREFRRRQEDTITSQAKKIAALEHAVESMSITFLELSATMLQSKYVQVSNQLAHSIRDATAKVLETARDAVEYDKEDRESEEAANKDYADEAEAVAAGQVIQQEYAELVYRPQIPLSPGKESSFGWPLPNDVEHASSIAIDIPDQTRISATQPSYTSTYPNTSLSREFWSADYINYTSTLPGEVPPTHLNFWQRLLRISIVKAYHALRGDPGYTILRIKSQFRFTINIRPVGFILANTRRILSRFDGYDRPVTRTVPIEHFFEDETTHALGRDARAEMARNGETPDDFVDASGVADYVQSKGQFYYDGETMKMALSVPAPSHHKRTTKKAASKTVINISVQALIDRLAAAATCMGDVVGYPKAILNAAIVASVIEMAV